MGRPDDEFIRARVRPHSSRVSGSCRTVSRNIYDGVAWGPDKPVKRGTFRTYIDRGYADEHYSFWAQWAGEDITVIDATIGQFGGEEQIFIGSQTEWLARVSTLCHGAPVVMDSSGAQFRQAHFREAEAEAYAEEIDAQWEGSRVVLVNREIHMIATVKRK